MELGWLVQVEGEEGLARCRPGPIRMERGAWESRKKKFFPSWID